MLKIYSAHLIVIGVLLVILGSFIVGFYIGKRVGFWAGKVNAAAKNNEEASKQIIKL